MTRAQGPRIKKPPVDGGKRNYTRAQYITAINDYQSLSLTAPFANSQWPHLLLRWGFFVGSMYMSYIGARQMRDERIVVQTTPEIKAMLRNLAASEQRTMSNLIERLITEAARERKAA